jgi:hypothetical protein
MVFLLLVSASKSAFESQAEFSFLCSLADAVGSWLRLRICELGAARHYLLFGIHAVLSAYLGSILSVVLLLF